MSKKTLIFTQIERIIVCRIMMIKILLMYYLNGNPTEKVVMLDIELMCFDSIGQLF